MNAEMDKLIADALATVAEAVSADKMEGRKPSTASILRQARAMTAAGWQPFDRKAFEGLAEYLAARDEELTTKGLLLTGPAGTGKTMFLATMFRTSPIPTTTIVNSWFCCNGQTGDAFWHAAMRVCDSETWTKPLFLNDLGKEAPAVYYGQRSEVLDDVLSQRYRDWQKTRVRTYITTNLNLYDPDPDVVTLEKRYGRRVTDRLREMCVIIRTTGPSRRG